LVRLIAVGESQVFRPIFDKVRSPANRIVLPTRSTGSVRRELLKVLATPHREQIMASHGIPQPAIEALVENNAERFTQARIRFLTGRLEKFVTSLGLPISEDLVADATDDTE